MNSPISVKLGDLFFVVIFIAFAYSLIYWRVCKIRFHDAVYKSVSIQTLSGNTIEPKTKGEKFIMVSQFLIAYLITSGLIIVSLGSNGQSGKN